MPCHECGEESKCEKCRRRAAREKWAAANPEKNRKSKRDWSKRNAAAVVKMKEAWRKANKDRWNTTGKAWKKAHPQAMRIYQLRKYGLTPESFQSLLDSQGGRCAICGTKEFGGPGKRPHVDHDHETNKLRGLLCVKCNAGIGQFQESTKFLLLAVDYLIAHGAPGLLQAEQQP
jgi:hypothetical protein